MNQMSNLLRVAENEVGYLEKASNNNLDDKTANAGKNNFTKYARDLIRLIGSPYANGVAWCDIFVDWCFVMAFGVGNAKHLLGGWSAYTPTSAGYFQKNLQWHTHSPKAGDVIFFKNSTRICHTGIVYKVDGTRVYTIEGNTSAGTNTVVPNGGGVFKKSYLLNNKSIAGFGRPKYDEKAAMIIPADDKVHGIDISANQGNVNFSLLKEQGIQFVVLRATTKNGMPDTKFEQYLKGCMTYKLDYSCYKYSYAETEEQAREEARTVIKLLGNRKMTIWYDVENTPQITKIKKAGLTKVIDAFLDECKKAGYDTGIYCNLNWYNNYIDDKFKKNVKMWVARYGKNNGKLDMGYIPNKNIYAWQYTSVGKVDGIDGDVDLDVLI